MNVFINIYLDHEDIEVNEDTLIHILNSFYHILILIPSDPDKSPFSIIYDFIHFIENYKWSDSAKMQLVYIYLFRQHIINY